MFLWIAALTSFAVFDFLLAQHCRSFGFASTRFELRSPVRKSASWILAFRRSCIPFRNSSNFCIPSPDFTWGVHFVQPRQNPLLNVEVGVDVYFHFNFLCFDRSALYQICAVCRRCRSLVLYTIYKNSFHPAELFIQ